MAAKSFLGIGDLYLDWLTPAGVSNGFELAGNATKFEITPDSETKEQPGRGRGNYGQVISSAVIPKPTKISIVLDQIDTEVMTKAFFGTNSVLNIAAGTVTDEAITALPAGKYFDLEKNNLTDTVVVKNDAGDQTYALGTDYDVTYRLGMIAILPGGAISAGDSLKVSYGFEAENRTKILGGTQPIIRVACRLDGQNYEDGSDVLVNVWEARLKPNTPIDFLSENFASLTLEGTLLAKTGKPSTFEVIR